VLTAAGSWRQIAPSILITPDRSIWGHAMNSVSPHPALTDLLAGVARGDPAALNAIVPLLYDELSALAHRQRRRWDGDFTLTTTALVHEAYLKLATANRIPAESRAHFLGVAAKAMRHILCNHARDRQRLKRGGGQADLDLDAAGELPNGPDLSPEQAAAMAALADAMAQLEVVAERQCRVVECRFFGGMSVADTAAALGISERTVKRDWEFARAWLRRELDPASEPG